MTAFLTAVKPISKYQFAMFRILFGLYLTVHFSHLVPYAAELFSHEGVLPDSHSNLTHGILPNLLEHTDTPAFVTAFTLTLAMLSILFTLGVFRRVVAVLLWYGLACLYNRNNLISNPSIPYVGLLLLLCAIIPVGDPFCLLPAKRSTHWFFPVWVFRSAWILMALGYSFSGIEKWIASPSWRDGAALAHVLRLPLARPGFLREALLSIPDCLKLVTWAALGLEALFLPLCLHSRTRSWAWLAMVTMHIGIVFLLSFADLAVGMLMLHLFTFDPDWLPARVKTSKASTQPTRRPLVLFDGVCGLCDRTVQFLFAEDRAKILCFAPLQSKIAAELLKQYSNIPRDTSTVVYIPSPDEPKIFVKSDAMLQILSDIGGFWRALSWLRFIPRFARDGIYNWIARHRYEWFGRLAECRRPDNETKARFLSDATSQ